MEIDNEDLFKKRHYTDEDRQLIISLLAEYSEKLLNACDRIGMYQNRVRIAALFFPFLAYMATLLTDFSKLSSDPLLRIIFFISLFFVVASTVNFLYEIRKTLELLERDAKRIALKLEKVIRVASQTQEHILDNFVNRIELDLRLADSESALDHYASMRRKKSLL
uniref:hypothetical protein n=1 Tax=Trichocoleus desertorum TaxID=1481672 RepID=UPI0025B2B004|nr:hypothetical protein [Trichocoleus desertorum]